MTRVAGRSSTTTVSSNGFYDTFMRLAKSEGLGSFYSSWGANAILCVNPAITYVAFEMIKSWVQRSAPHRVNFTIVHDFMIGVVSKMLATVVTYPAIRAKVLINTGSAPCEEGKIGMRLVVSTIIRIFRDQGVQGLFAGVKPQLLKAALNAALMLAVKERISKRVKSFF